MVHRSDLALQRTDSRRLSALPNAAQWTSQAIDERMKRLVGTVDVLTHVDAAWRDTREQAFDCYGLLPRQVATVVNDDVDMRAVAHERCPERGIALVADENLNALVGKSRAAGIDINAADLGAGSEVVPPHAKASAPGYSYLDQADILTAKSTQVAVVDVEIVPPLVYAGPLDVSLGIRLERAGRRSPLGRHRRPDRRKMPTEPKPTGKETCRLDATVGGLGRRKLIDAEPRSELSRRRSHPAAV